MRRVRLPSGREIILSDTVGFIADLPTFLVAAFRATLEEVMEADLILHVRDSSHPATHLQHQDVLKILKDLGVEQAYEESGIEILNKCDLLEAEERERLKTKSLRASHPAQCIISALDGQGTQTLLEKIDQILARKEKIYRFELLLTEGKKIAWLYSHGEVLERKDDEVKAHMTVKISLENRDRFNQVFKSTKYS
jgi:GTP-binding protein HflX